MPVTLEQGDIFGRIGKAFGEGIGEGSLKQYGANRISDALKPEEGKPFNPLDTTQRLIRAQASPQEISQYLPLIQQEQARKEAFPQAEPVNGNFAPGINPIAQEATQVSPISAGKAFQPLQGTTQALETRARELMTNQPSLYRDPLKAMEKAQTEYQNQQDILTKTSTEFDNVVKKRLQKYGTDIDQAIIGDMQQDYLRQAQALAASGKISPEKAVDKISKDLLDFAKARTNLKAVKLSSQLASNAKTTGQANLNSIRKAYQDADQLELFENDLVNEQGLTTPVASYLAFPIKENKEINNFAQSTRIKPHLLPLGGSPVMGLKEKNYNSYSNRNKGTKRSEQEIGEFVAKNLGDNDSLNSIAMAFSAKGYDPQLILDAIEKSPKVRLNKRQEQDLQKRTSFRPSLKDISFFASTGLPPQEIIP